LSFKLKRNQLVERLVAEEVIHSKEVIRAMGMVPREEFVRREDKGSAYVDTPLPLFKGQTISAPHMVAMMCGALELRVGERVLEIGAGSGYHAAVISEIVAPKGSENPGHVYTIEIHKLLSEFAKDNLNRTSYSRAVTVINGDGSKGLPEHAPYDKILVTAAAPEVPKPLIDQLNPSGILVVPVGDKHAFQVLRVLKKKQDGTIEVKDLWGVAFVPLRGEHGWKD